MQIKREGKSICKFQLGGVTAGENRGVVKWGVGSGVGCKSRREWRRQGQGRRKWVTGTQRIDSGATLWQNHPHPPTCWLPPNSAILIISTTTQILTLYTWYDRRLLYWKSKLFITFCLLSTKHLYRGVDSWNLSPSRNLTDFNVCPTPYQKSEYVLAKHYTFFILFCKFGFQNRIL